MQTVIISMMLLEIVKFPAKVLQRPSRRIIEADLAELPELFEQMKEAMRQNGGIGLAAPQVGKGIRLFIAHNSRAGITRAFVNPQILSSSAEKDVASEGCLSFPELFGDVERHIEITLQYQDIELTHHQEVFHGWFARVLQHELDHLNGILLPDRALDGMYAAEESEDADDAEHSEEEASNGNSVEEVGTVVGAIHPEGDD